MCRALRLLGFGSDVSSNPADWRVTQNEARSRSHRESQFFLKYHEKQEKNFLYSVLKNLRAKKELKIPNLGENIASAEVLKILVKVGDKVEKEQSVLEISSDNFPLRSWRSVL